MDSVLDKGLLEDLELATWARNTMESAIDPDIVREMAKAGTMPAKGSDELYALLHEAVDAVKAKLYYTDKVLYMSLRTKELTTKQWGAIWDLLNKGRARDGGLSDWDKTVFETIRTRKHLYEDEWVESPFEVERGDFRYFAGLTDPMVMKAVAWLEGDDKEQPVNDRRDRLRDNGDYILEFKTGRKSKWGKEMTATVIIHKPAFEERLFEDEDGNWDHLQMKRGRKPSGRVIDFTLKYGKDWVPTSGYLVRTRGAVGEVVPIGQISYEAQCKAEPRWSEPTSVEIPDDLITEEFIRAVADASEDETVPTLDIDHVDEEFSVI